MMEESEEAKKVVSKFYRACDLKDYETAFDCLTPELQEARWPEGVEKFAYGYQYTKKIFNVIPTAVKQEYASVTVSVHYEEVTNVLRHPYFPDQDEKLHLLDLADASESFGGFMISTLGANPEAVDKIPAEAYFGENNVETVLWHAGVKPEVYKDHVQVDENKGLTKARLICCTKTENDGWKISSIKGYDR